MSSLTRTMLPAFALAAMMSVAQAQTPPARITTPTTPGDTRRPDADPSQPMQDAQPGTPATRP